MGRDVIAITSVGGRAVLWSVILPGGRTCILTTAAMAMAALPEAVLPPLSSIQPSSLFPFLTMPYP